jgi:hypothetical protein
MVVVEVPLWMAHKHHQQQQQQPTSVGWYGNSSVENDIPIPELGTPMMPSSADGSSTLEAGKVLESWSLLKNTGPDRRLAIYSIDAIGNLVATAGYVSKLHPFVFSKLVIFLQR